ncbi:MAG: apolipoprotein N-acyltransferase, partial [Fibrobacterota bacterium]
PISPLAQLGSVGGVYLLSFLIVLGNILIFELLRSYWLSNVIAQKWLHLAVFATFLAGVYFWGMIKIEPMENDRINVSVLQINLDQTNWGNNSLDSSLNVVEKMILEHRDDSLDLIVLPESAIYCYLLKRPHIRDRVASWADRVGTPIITGSLHWEYAEDVAKKYDVFNTAYMIAGATDRFIPYYKMQLVPGSESIPFKSQFPILSRLNIGSADFSRGTEPVVFNAGKEIMAAPFICYEMIFPALVRKRVQEGANLLVNITNDGWFGRSTAPHQHAIMARMRSIENGVSLVRSANSGISLAADQFGRELGRTGLFTRDSLVVSVPLSSVKTIYTRYGDWLVWLSLVFLLLATSIRLFMRFSSNPPVGKAANRKE